MGSLGVITNRQLVAISLINILIRKLFGIGCRQMLTYGLKNVAGAIEFEYFWLLDFFGYARRVEYGPLGRK